MCLSQKSSGAAGPGILLRVVFGRSARLYKAQDGARTEEDGLAKKRSGTDGVQLAELRDAQKTPALSARPPRERHCRAGTRPVRVDGRPDPIRSDGAHRALDSPRWPCDSSQEALGKESQLATVRLPAREITDWGTFHAVCQRTLGFPHFYGRNMDAWIDCLSSLDEEEGAGMTRFALKDGERLLIEIDESMAFKERIPEVFSALIDCTAFVNNRYVEHGQPPLVGLFLV